MGKLLSIEPVFVIVTGGTAITQIVLRILAKYTGVDISPGETAAITSLVGLSLSLWARNLVTPMASLPPGVAGEIADAKIAAKS